MTDAELRETVERFLSEVYGGTAHPIRRQVLDEFIEWVARDRAKFHAECDRKINAVLDSIPGIARVV